MPDDPSRRLYPALYPNFDRQFDREAKAQPPAPDLDEDDRPLWRRVAAGVGVDDEIDAASDAWRTSSDWVRSTLGLDTPEAQAAAAALDRRMAPPSGPGLVERALDSEPVRAFGRQLHEDYKHLWTPTPEATYMADLARQALDRRKAERAPALAALGPVVGTLAAQDDLIPRLLIDTAEGASHPVGALSNLPVPAGALAKVGVAGMAGALPPKLVAAVEQLFPKYDKWGKPAGLVSRATLLKRVEGAADLTPAAKAKVLRQLAEQVGERRVAPAEVQALAAGQPYTPDRVLRKVKAPVEGAKPIPGAPLGVTNARQARALRERYLGTMETGAGGRDWYHDSGESLLFHANDDPARARLVTGDMAITSPTTSVSANTGFGIKGYNQATAGVPVVTGRYPAAMGKNIDALHAGGEGSLGLKRDPFAQNIALGGGYQDPAVDAAKRAVHDIWDAEAHGYVNPDGSPMRTGFGPAQHRFMDEQQDKILATANARGTAGYTDWDELRSQAAGWTGQQIEAERLDPSAAAQSIADFLPRHYAQESREFTPGGSTGHTPELLGEGMEEARRRYAAVMMAEASPYDAQMRDQIAASYGALVGPSFEGPGLFQGTVSPGMQTQVLTGSERVPGGAAGARQLDEGSRRLLDATAASYGIGMGQDAAAYSRLLAPGSGVAPGLWDVALPGGTLTTPQMDTLLQHFGPAVLDGKAVIPTPDGVRLGLMDPDMKQAIVRLLGGKVKPEAGVGLEAGLASGYLGNDWRTLGGVGSTYLNPIRQIGGAAAYDQYNPAWIDRVRKADALFRRDSGGRVTMSQMLDEVWGAAANEGFAGLERLAKKYGIPVMLLAAGLQVLQGQDQPPGPPEM